MFGSLVRSCLLTALLSLLSVSSLFAQPAGVKAGDKIEYLDGRGVVQKGEFIEMVGASVKVKQEDGQTKIFPGTRVRLPGGAAANRPRLGPAGGDIPIPSRPAATAPANPFEAAAAEVRTWTDATGKFKIEASFVSLDKDQVQLKKTDGKFITLAMDKLSAEDQVAAREAADKAKAPPMKDENPFEANVTDKPQIAGLGAERKTSLNGVPLLTLDAPAAWGAAANPSTVALPKISNRAASIPPRAIAGPNGRVDDFFEKAEGMIVDPAHGWLWIGVKNEHGGKNCRLERVEIASSAAMPPLTMPTLLRPISVDPTGRLLLTSRDDDFQTRNKHLDIWEIDGNEVRATSSFKPFDDGEGKHFSVKAFKWAEFVDSTHLLTLGDSGKLVMWDLSTAGVIRGLYQIDLGSGWSLSCALSPGRKQLAVATSSGVYVLEPISGKVLGKCEMKDDGASRLSIYRIVFSDDGAQLAAAGPLNLWVWNVADGKNTAAVSGTSMHISHETALSFGSHNHLIIDHRYAFDIERGLMTCSFSGSTSSTAVSFAGREWFLNEDRGSGGKSRSIISFALPGEEVVRKAATVKEEELLAIKPGSKIGLDLALPFDGAESEKIRTSITTAFVNNGWAIAAPGEASDFVLTARAMPGETKEIEYRMFGRGFATTKVSVTYQLGEMSLKSPGSDKPVWQNKASWGPPFNIHLKEGQTIEEATRTTPNAAFFANPGIPRRLMKYPNGVSIVTATLAPSGITVQ
ncbi:SHD1 domain-containing protein [Anatilimnocola floriformis]|uniref:SHD1 domain-containing protein n=1 Tax=Anatilimnocola floriformis TaxID=2948575 RepID=UPI0020C589ED|nr:SHD1 domain-containing protein [Anatilimnocola floriformis]